MSLFPTQGRGGGQSGPEPLVSFKAGKMEVTERPGNKFLVSPDLRKGKISLIQTDGNLIHFQWSDRTQNTVVDDLIVFPDTVTFSKVNTGREGDRVYLLQWRGQDRRFFFWMQDKDTSKDEENARKINEYVNNPPQAQQPSSEPWMDMMSQATGRAGRGAAPAAGNGQGGAAGGSVQLSQLANILAGLGLPPAPSASTGAAAAPAAAPTSAPAGTAAAAPTPAPAAAPAPAPAAAAPAAAPGAGQLTQEDLQRAMMGVVSGLARRRALNLSDVMDSDEVLRSGVLDRSEVQSELLELLPESQRDPENLRATLRSAQFRQALHALSAALQSDSFNSVMANFGLDPQAGAESLVRGDSVRAFLEALLAAYEPENQGEQPMDQGGSS